MPHFPATVRRIPSPPKRLRQTHPLPPRRHFPHPRCQPVNPRPRRPQPQQHTRPRRIAQRCLTMRIRKHHPARAQSIQMRCLHLPMPTQHPHPVIQIIRHQKQHVRWHPRHPHHPHHQHQKNPSLHPLPLHQPTTLATTFPHAPTDIAPPSHLLYSSHHDLTPLPPLSPRPPPDLHFRRASLISPNSPNPTPPHPKPPSSSSGSPQASTSP